MALYNVSTANNSLLAITSDAHCTSEVVDQTTGETDFESIRAVKVWWHLTNISSPNSTADTLVSTVPLDNGDRIFIRTSDGTIYDTVAQGVVQNAAASQAFPLMSSNTTPAGVASNSAGDADAYKAFDGDSATTQLDLAIGSSAWVQYQFKDNTPTTISQYYLKLTHANTIVDCSWVVEGSIDGTNYSTLATASVDDGTVDGVYTIGSPGAYSYYRITITHVSTSSSPRLYVNLFSLLKDGGATADTSAITAGEVPTQVFKFTDTLNFNGGPSATEKDVYMSYGDAGHKLVVASSHDDYPLTGRTLDTRLQFTSAGNEVVELTGQVYKQP